MTTTMIRRHPPRRLIAGAGLGAAWNLFGIVQFAGKMTSDAADFVAAGNSPAQAELFANLPLWMDAAFGIAAIAGTIGSALLLAHRPGAAALLALSLAAYVALFAGDVAHGVFAAFGAPLMAVVGGSVLLSIALVRLAARPH